MGNGTADNNSHLFGKPTVLYFENALAAKVIPERGEPSQRRAALFQGLDLRLHGHERLQLGGQAFLSGRLKLCREPLGTLRRNYPTSKLHCPYRTSLFLNSTRSSLITNLFANSTRFARMAADAFSSFASVAVLWCLVVRGDASREEPDVSGLGGVVSLRLGLGPCLHLFLRMWLLSF